MDWTEGIQRAIDYIELHIDENLDYAQIAKQAFSSCYHFQRTFSIICGVSPAEYIRRRRLSLAGQELTNPRAKVIDVALKYGYETPESFSRAFFRFHGVRPSQAKKGCSVKIYSPLCVRAELTGGNESPGAHAEPTRESTHSCKSAEWTERAESSCVIAKKPALILVGYKARFHGVPYGPERAKQEERFMTGTRAKQWLLLGASSDYEKDYCIVTNADDEEYDFYIAYELDAWTREALYDKKVTGVGFMEEMHFETIVIPEQTYLIFKTPKKKRPVQDYIEMRQKIAESENLLNDYVFCRAPELTIMHWRPAHPREKTRYIEICLPIERKKV